MSAETIALWELEIFQNVPNDYGLQKCLGATNRLPAGGNELPLCRDDEFCAAKSCASTQAVLPLLHCLLRGLRMRLGRRRLLFVRLPGRLTIPQKRWAKETLKVRRSRLLIPPQGTGSPRAQ